MKNMARKFALYLKDGHEVRNNIEEIAEYFDYGKMVEYFHDGSLLQWLEDRRYEKEAIALSALKANKSDFKEKLCYIFKVDSKTIADNTAIEDVTLIKKRDLIKQYTNDENILGNIDKVAIDNNELLDLINTGIKEIYLCGNTFTIPDTAENVRFVGVNKPYLVVRRYNIENKSQNNVEFDNVCILDENGNAVQNSVSASVENEKNIEKVWNNVAAELLGVLIHGKLKSGEDIFSREGKAKEARRITYQAWPDDILTKDIDMGDVASGLREDLYQHNKSIIGAVIEFCSRASNQYLIIADKAFYVQQSDCVWKTIRYEKIDKVQVYNNTELVIAQYNKQWWHLPFAQMWKLKMGLNNFRLFLKKKKKILGGCKYKFNKEELKKLRKVKLESLDGACILDYLE